MKYNFITYPTFDREFQRLAKKYLSLKQDILALIQEIERNPYAGTDLGNNIYKYRLSIASKGKGKSGGEWAYHKDTYQYIHNYLDVIVEIDGKEYVVKTQEGKLRMIWD